MAWNAVLVNAPEDPESARYGRSYMEHVVALAADEGLPAEVRAAAQLLKDAPPRPPELVNIGKPDLTPLEAARTLVAHAKARSARTDS